MLFKTYKKKFSITYLGFIKKYFRFFEKKQQKKVFPKNGKRHAIIKIIIFSDFR